MCRHNKPGNFKLMVKSTVTCNDRAILRMVVDCSRIDCFVERSVLLGTVELSESGYTNLDMMLAECILRFGYLALSMSCIDQPILR